MRQERKARQARQARATGTSGKFQTEPIRERKDIERVLRLDLQTGCLRAPEELPFGTSRGGTWFVQVGELTGKGRRKVRQAVRVIFDSHYPFSLGRGERRTGYKFFKICKTTGCMNYRHYELRNRKNKTSGEYYMTDQRLINLLTSTLRQDETISFGDASSAESFRMHIYRLRRKWKKEARQYYEMFGGVIIKKDKLHPNILEFTTRGRSFDDVLARFQDEPAGSKTEPMSVEEKEYIDAAVRGSDKGTEIFKQLGYSGERVEGLAPGAPPEITYDSVYAKAIQGVVLTEEEVKVFEKGAEPYRTPEGLEE